MHDGPAWPLAGSDSCRVTKMYVAHIATGFLSKDLCRRNVAFCCEVDYGHPGSTRLTLMSRRRIGRCCRHANTTRHGQARWLYHSPARMLQAQTRIQAKADNSESGAG